MISKLKTGSVLISLVCLFLLSGCGAPSDGDDADGENAFLSIVPEGDRNALLSWTPPTENTDGSPLVDLAGYRIYYGISPGSYSESVNIPNPGLTSFMVEGLGISEWYFVMTAYNTSGVESGYSPEVFVSIE